LNSTEEGGEDDITAITKIKSSRIHTSQTILAEVTVEDFMKDEAEVSFEEEDGGSVVEGEGEI